MNEIIWKTITIHEFFDVLNLSPLHKVNLISDSINGIPYITRTEKNNGIEDFVKNDGFQLHTGKCITFGAETVKFFYQPFDFLCGNKMEYFQIYLLNKSKDLLFYHRYKKQKLHQVLIQNQKSILYINLLKFQHYYFFHTL